MTRGQLFPCNLDIFQTCKKVEKHYLKLQKSWFFIFHLKSSDASCNNKNIAVSKLPAAWAYSLVTGQGRLTGRAEVVPTAWLPGCRWEAEPTTVFPEWSQGPVSCQDSQHGIPLLSRSLPVPHSPPVFLLPHYDFSSLRFSSSSSPQCLNIGCRGQF